MADLKENSGEVRRCRAEGTGGAKKREGRRRRRLQGDLHRRLRILSLVQRVPSECTRSLRSSGQGAKRAWQVVPTRIGRRKGQPGAGARDEASQLQSRADAGYRLATPGTVSKGTGDSPRFN